MKAWLKDYLTMSKKERMGMMALMCLVASIWLLPRWFGNDRVDAALAARADSLIATGKDTLLQRPLLQRLHTFDPNAASDEELLGLGFTERNVRTLRNYISKGGRLRQPSDIHRIYGISPGLAAQLEPYIRIASSGPVHTRAAPAVYQRETYNRPYYVRMVDEAVAQKRVQHYTVLDLNKADTTALIELPGIGSKLAARIVLFRERCGGFHSVDQLAEVYGIRDSLFQYLKPRLKVMDPQLRLLRINALEADSLAMHPYLKRSEARAIVQYRQQHGPYKEVEDLLAIAIITKELLVKLSPYLDFN